MIVIDIAIGLIFVFLLYSLLATIIVEIYANIIQLRAKMLERAIKRMLLDDKNIPYPSWVERIVLFYKKIIHVRKGKKAWNKIYQKQNLKNLFYSQPAIRYLGQNWFRAKPSYIKPELFSKSLFDLLKSGGELTDLDNIRENIKGKTIKVEEGKTKMNPVSIDEDTAKHLSSLLKDAKYDLDKFKKELENWYDSTMERVTGWYKRRVQLFLFIVGFVLAFVFNVDTIQITRKLSKDENARNQLVELAASVGDTVYYKYYNGDTTKVFTDTISYGLIDKAKQLIEEDIASANNILALGWDIPDSILYRAERMCKYGSCKYYPLSSNFPFGYKVHKYQGDTARFKVSWEEKACYVACKIDKDRWKLLGFLLTALAISLGAPFWYDMLNKIMKLRASIPHKTPKNEKAQGESPKNIKG